ncbi:MAG: 16S rRNA (cytidine(1402)-2'-O)-methyltransferase [Chloroflexi bacterium]|nr:16S rRNA (cytidine(1402)-2'-O)-methyltransferase [Chloroflexota bacterium]
MLSIVSTPIGNPDDITLRALRVLRDAHAVICEERRHGARLLKQYQIENEIVDLNEHTERERVPELIARLQRGQHLALISDHGTPLLADPGARLIERAIAAHIPITAVPGASSVLAALVVSGLPIENFRFVGMLSPKKETRRAELHRLKSERATWVLLDAPYRLNALLADLREVLGDARRVVVACELTTASEKILRGTLREIVNHFEKNPFKGEYVIVVARMKN